MSISASPEAQHSTYVSIDQSIKAFFQFRDDATKYVKATKSLMSHLDLIYLYYLIEELV